MAATTARMVPGYRHVPGNHCGSTALRNLLAFHGLEMSEEMALGLGAGVSFYYVVLEGSSPSRFTNGRTGRLEEQFVELTGAPLRLATFDDPEVAWDTARGAVDAGRPAILITDLYYLDHYGKSAHFPGHAVVLAGYDSDVAYLSDTGFEDLQTTRLEGLKQARHGDHPVFPLEGHMFTVDPESGRSTQLHRRRAPRHRALRARHARAGARRLPGAPGASPLRRRGRLMAGAGGGLAVVRPLPLPGDRAPGDRRRQLPAHVLALSRGGRIRGERSRRSRGRSVDLARRRGAGRERARAAGCRPVVGGRHRGGRPSWRPRSACGARFGKAATCSPHWHVS